MLRSGIVNPQLLALLARTRHTNTLVIADRGFPSWPQIEIVDLSLSDNIPTVLQVLTAIKAGWHFKQAWMAHEFCENCLPEDLAAISALVEPDAICFESHAALKLRVPLATGIIRTADCTPYANIILESA